MLLNLGGTNPSIVITILCIYCNNFFHIATKFLKERVSVCNLCKDQWASCGVRGEEIQGPNSFFPTCQSHRCTYHLIKKQGILEGRL